MSRAGIYIWQYASFIVDFVSEHSISVFSSSPFLVSWTIEVCLMLFEELRFLKKWMIILIPDAGAVRRLC